MTWRNTILVGDVRERLAELPDQSVQCVVTSPPYWGLRDYGTASWAGGDDGCDHKAPPAGGTGPASAVQVQVKRLELESGFYRDACGKCGATRIDAQVGLEPTPEAYVSGMVEVFREVRRVLRDDGTLWLNLGDSYTSGGRDYRDVGNSSGKIMHGNYSAGMNAKGTRAATPAGLKPKDLVGIPWRVAFALQADGWWLRSDIIWSKPNPMPESVTDRPTKAHEYVFLLSKSATYYYDHDAIQEPLTAATVERYKHGWNGDEVRGYPQDKGPKHNNFSKWMGSEEAMASTGRNKRSVWEIATKPYAEAHFATYPPELVKPCILAGSREGDVILDPFMGSGTTALVAIKAGRDFVGIELNPTYAAMAERRIAPYRDRLL